MQWNLINLKCKIVPYTLLPILLPEASSVLSCLWILCYMSSEPDKLSHINAEEQPHRIETWSDILLIATMKSGYQ